MATDEEAQAAISMLNDKDFGGRNLTVNEARPKVSSGGFGGGGDFGGNGGGNGRRRSEPRW
jgi:RNA recognition motif-containing protein